MKNEGRGMEGEIKEHEKLRKTWRMRGTLGMKERA